MTKVVVTTKEGQSIKGIRCFSLFRFVLIEAELLDGVGAELEGKIVISRSNVAMVQILP